MANLKVFVTNFVILRRSEKQQDTTAIHSRCDKVSQKSEKHYNSDA